ncbi:MAG: hypothetical protein K6G80_04645 [Treponema sp.]|nr:hypothetical protein [Treponema sp.]
MKIFNITKISKTVVIAAAAGAVLSFASCTSTQPIADDMSAQELIQNGQSSFETGNYKMSLRYFNAVVERYSDNLAVCIEAKYEIAHLYMKKKMYSSAVPVFEEICEIYKNVTPGVLPAAYEKLSQLELAKLTPEQLSKAHADMAKKQH